MRKLIQAGFVAATALTAFTGALTADSQTAFAQYKQQGDWLVRGRAIWIAPNEDQSVSPAAVGGDADISNELVPELDISYFFTDNIAAELILAVAEHDVDLEDTAAGDVDLGSVTHAPASLLLQYHFDPIGVNNVSPYIGAGLNYTMFLDEDASAQLNSIDYENSLKYVIQAGADIPLDENWSLNFDAKYMWIETDLDANVIGVGNVDAEVDIDPLVLGVGIGYRF